MRYLQRTSISLLILTALSFSALAAKTESAVPHEINLAQEQAKWAQQQHDSELLLIKQRSTFLQLENLLKSAVKNNNVSDNAELYLNLIESLKGYPLQMDATTTYIDARIKSVSKDTPPEEVKALKHEIEQVIAQNPTHFLRNRWEQGIFTLLINADDTEGLVHYAQRVKPSSLEMQIAVLNAELQLERTKNETNKKQNSNSDSNIISRYEQLWLANSKLPNDAQLWAKWYSDGKRTQDKIYQKAEELFAQNDANGMALLSSELNKIDSAKEDEMVLANLKRFESLLKNPATLPELADRLPLIEENNKIVTKFEVVQTFPRYLRTLSETMKEPNFAPYQQWAKNWQLTDAQIREWEIAFLGRFFDNESPNFQQWRDAEILKLKADNIDYYVSYTNEGYTGKLVFYNVSEEFLQYAVGEEQVDELIAERSTSQGEPITLMFQIEGDKRAVRHCLTQVVVKRPNVGSATKDGNNFNKVELNFIASPRPNDKVVKYKTSKKTTKETYNKFFDEVKATM